MALKGTLKDFGIADIFQLISHQSKTGVLHLKSKNKEVRIAFSNGDVVRAESTTRKKKDLLGTMLVRAEIISEEQLEKALETQRRTLKRLGDLLVEAGFVSRKELREFAHLQITETLYKLFNWETGTYGFETEDVTYDAETIEPIRSENILMEGFRMVDEWPMIRKKITSYDMTFKKLKLMEHLGEGVQTEADGVDSAFDDMLSAAPKKKKEKNIGSNERTVFGLVTDSRNVDKLINLSRLGEFETCKALYNLILEGYLKAASKRDTRVIHRGKPGGKNRSFSISRMMIQIMMYAILVGLFLVLYQVFELNPLSLFQESATQRFQDPVVRELLDRSQIQRIHTALEVYRMEQGQYPKRLNDLVQLGLLTQGDVAFPWRQSHHYHLDEEGYSLLRPFE